MFEQDPLVRGLYGPARLAFVLYLVWSFAIGAPAGLGLLMAFSWILTPLGIGVASVCAGLALANVVAAVQLAVRRPEGWTTAASAAVGGLIASQAPVLVRIALPWEEPGTGEGSPMAVLLGVVFYGTLFGVVFTLPGFALCVWLWMSEQIRAPRVPRCDRSPLP